MRTQKYAGGGRAGKSKPLPGAGALPTTSAMIGGISNRTVTPSSAKSGRTSAFNKGGVVETTQGGFRNAGMVNRR